MKIRPTALSPMMSNQYNVKVIAHIRTGFPEKFGIPRQSGLVGSLTGKIVFEPEYRNPDAVRGLDEFSHLWLIWQFSEAVRDAWSPTVRPPRLGGNKRMGVFATRSPFRPNAIGLSSVKIDRVEPHTEDGPVIYVLGADLMDNTPIFDIKPYLAYTDSHPDASGGFTEPLDDRTLTVHIPDRLLDKVPAESRDALYGLLAEDPRPSYQHDADRVYRFDFAGMAVAFKVDGKRLEVTEIE